MSYKSLKRGNITWSWKEYGRGKRILLAFHGFNRSPEDFHSFERWLGHEFTILAFDLFFHGASTVDFHDTPPPLSRPVLKEFIEAVLIKYNVREFDVLAYSFGGRLALNCVELFEERVKGLYLMASDAMRFNPGYYFAVQTRIGRAVFRSYLINPKPLMQLMKLVASLGWSNKKAIEFYMHHMVFEAMRYKVYNCWMLHRETVPDINSVTKLIKENNTSLLLFFGKFDIIIPPKLGAGFAKKAGRKHALHILDIGHRLPEKHQEISEIILRTIKS
ncbi:MAG: alpha/beta hydrolase [Bacteroidetes bacterium]|nr:alpha/beta hydrolase [Bacteroidota bacterium]